MMSPEITIALIGVFSTVIGSWTSWFFARKKYNTEVDSNLIENMQKSLEFYMKLSDDNKERLEEALKRNDQLQNEVTELRTQVFKMMNSMCFNITCQLRKKETINKRESNNETNE